MSNRRCHVVVARCRRRLTRLPMEGDLKDIAAVGIDRGLIYDFRLCSEFWHTIPTRK